MPAVTVRNLSAETHRALKLGVKAHGRSTEAVIRAILDEAVSPPIGVHIGSALAAFGQRHGGLDLDIVRDPAIPGPAKIK